MNHFHGKGAGPSPLQTQPGYTAPHDPSSENAFDLELAGAVVRRHWRWMFPFALIFAAAVVGVRLHLRETHYEAIHWIEAAQDYLAFEGVMPRIRDLLRTEGEIIKSAIVLDPVLADVGLRSAPSLANPQLASKQIRENLSLQSGGTQGRIKIVYQDKTPEAAMQVCNAIAESYLRVREAFDTRHVENLATWLQPEVQRWEQVVRERQKTVESLTLASTLNSMEEEIGSPDRFDVINSLRLNITEIRVKMAVAQAQLDAMDETWSPDQQQLKLAIEADPEIAHLIQKASQYRSLIREIEVSGLDRINDEQLKSLVAGVESTTNQLEQERRLAEPRVKERLRSDYASTLRRELKLLQVQLDSVEASFREEQGRILNSGDYATKLRFAEDELRVANEVLNRLRNRTAAIRTEQQYHGSVRSIAEAPLPERPVPDSIWDKELLLMIALCFGVPFALGSLWEFKNKKLASAGAVTKKNQLRLVGEVAPLPRIAIKPRNSSSKKQSTQSCGDDPFLQSIDSLRVKLSLGGALKHGQTLSIVSAFSGEGKSTIGSSLARSIARSAPASTLLIDCDLRKPHQHRLFDVDLGPGVCEVLENKIALEDAIVQTACGVWLLPAGSSPYPVMDYFTETAIESLLSDASQKFDAVIVDTAPLNYAPESFLIARASNSVLLSMLRDVSKVEAASQVIRNLRELDINLIGGVFSGVSPGRYPYSYRYGSHASRPSRIVDQSLVEEPVGMTS